MFLAALVVIGILTLLGPQIGYIGEHPSKPRLKAISCPSATTCYAVGEAIMATKDGGKTWVTQEAGLTNLLEDISCPNTEVCWAVGSKGMVRLTTNGG